MNSQQTCFTSFKQNIESYVLPKCFTFPFYYQPHPLCLLAVQELQQQLTNNANYQQEFAQTGKMFGVLLVKNSQGEVGYLCAFSGKLNVGLTKVNFVPAVFDALAQTDFYQRQNVIINQLNQQLEQLKNNDEMKKCQTILISIEEKSQQEVSAWQKVMATNRAKRKQKRNTAQHALSNLDFTLAKEQLAKESVFDKN
ncbi:MAG: RNA pseudouridine synthase, partial [Colwellia sp.]|nr:RNA pseudouridine synthase [Colwellia sp.]